MRCDVSTGDDVSGVAIKMTCYGGLMVASKMTCLASLVGVV